MPRQIMNIGPVPTDESAAQVGRPDYDERSRRECRVFQRMLARSFPLPADSQASLVIQSFPHDFGRYREVCVRYDDTDPAAEGYAFQLEGDTPARWDAVACYELAWLERLDHLNRAVRIGAMAPADVPEIYRSGEFPALPTDLSFAQLLAAFPL